MEREKEMTPERHAIIVANKQQLRNITHQENALASFESAIAGRMDVREYMQKLLIAFQRDDIAETTVESQLKCMRDIAALCLMPTQGHVALIPRALKGQGLCCTWMPQWQGMIALMMRSPNVRDIRVVLVHKLDKIEIDSMRDLVISHTKDHFNPKRVFNTMGDVTGGYLHVMFTDREDRFHFVHPEAIQKARKCANTDAIWRQWFERMCLKTIVRDAYSRKVIELDPLVTEALQAAVAQEDLVHGNDPMRGAKHENSSIVPTTVAHLTAMSQKAIEHKPAKVAAPPKEEAQLETLPVEPKDPVQVAEEISEPIAQADSEAPVEPVREVDDNTGEVLPDDLPWLENSSEGTDWEAITATLMVTTTKRQLTDVFNVLKNEVRDDEVPKLQVLARSRLNMIEREGE